MIWSWRLVVLAGWLGIAIAIAVALASVLALMLGDALARFL